MAQSTTRVARIAPSYRTPFDVRQQRQDQFQSSSVGPDSPRDPLTGQLVSRQWIEQRIAQHRAALAQHGRSRSPEWQRCTAMSEDEEIERYLGTNRPVYFLD